MMKATGDADGVPRTGLERRGQTWDDIFTGLTPDAPGAKQQGEGFTL